MSLETILSLLAALGGFELIRWLVTTILHRRTDRRKERASATAAEDENERKQVTWLENRLAERDAKIDALYVELRQEQGARLEEVHRRHEVELQLKEAALKRCDVHGCTNRRPPSDY